MATSILKPSQIPSIRVLLHRVWQHSSQSPNRNHIQRMNIAINTGMPSQLFRRGIALSTDLNRLIRFKLR